MSEPFVPSRLSDDCGPILEESRLKRQTSEHLLERARYAIKRSHFRLTRSAERLLPLSPESDAKNAE